MNSIEQLGFINECISILENEGRSFNEALKLVKLNFSIPKDAINAIKVIYKSKTNENESDSGNLEKETNQSSHKIGFN